MKYVKVRIKKPGNAIAEPHELEYNFVMGQEYLVLPDGTEIYFEEDEIATIDSLYEKDQKIDDLEYEVDRLEEELSNAVAEAKKQSENIKKAIVDAMSILDELC